MVLGRGATASVDLAHAAVSRRHCELRPMGDGSWTVTDLGSSNGTRVNDDLLLAPARIEPGDVLELGGVAQFVAEAVDPATRLAPETGPMVATAVVREPVTAP